MENLTMKQWVYNQYNSFYHFMLKIDEDAADSLWLYDEPYTRIGNFVIEICKDKGTVTILNTNNGKCAIAHCAPTDKFERWYGLGICWARYNHVEPPKFPVRKRLSELKPHDIFSLYTGKKYEFIGTVNNSTSDAKYVAFGLHQDKTKDFFTFCDDKCTVWE